MAFQPEVLIGIATSPTPLHSYGFKPTRYDKDVWIQLSENKTHNEYICTYVDDFMIAPKKLEAIMELIKKKHSSKDEGPHLCYLGNDYEVHN